MKTQLIYKDYVSFPWKLCAQETGQIDVTNACGASLDPHSLAPAMKIDNIQSWNHSHLSNDIRKELELDVDNSYIIRKLFFALM